MFNPELFKDIEDSVLETTESAKKDETSSDVDVRKIIQEELAKMKDKSESQDVIKNEKIVESEVEDVKRPKGDSVMVNNVKVTLEGKLAVLSNDGFYYSINNDGSMKREYTVLENVSKPLIRERVKLQTGDVLVYDNKLCFCSSSEGNKYEITNFADKSMFQIQKGDESDELGDTYQVVINPLESILEADKNADVLTLLANNPQNAPAINLALQREQSNALSQLSSFIIDNNKSE